MYPDFDIEPFKKLTKAIASYGMHSAFTRRLIEQLATQFRVILYDWAI